MSKQLTLSATLSALAMGAMALAMTLGWAGDAGTGSGARAATAHGSLVQVILSV